MTQVNTDANPMHQRKNPNYRKIGYLFLAPLIAVTVSACADIGVQARLKREADSKSKIVAWMGEGANPSYAAPQELDNYARKCAIVMGMNSMPLNSDYKSKLHYVPAELRDFCVTAISSQNSSSSAEL